MGLKLKYWLVFISLVFNAIYAGHLIAIETIKPKSICTLTIGMDHWPPYQVFESDGSVKGLQITLVRKIADQIGCMLLFKKMSYPKALEALKDGDIDMQLNASFTEERTNFAHFTAPYRAEFMLLYSTEKYAEKCQTMDLEQLIQDGFKLAVQHGVAYGPELTRIQNNFSMNKKLYYVENSVQHLQLLKEKNLDGVVDDPTVVAYRSSINSTGDALRSCPITISHDPLSFMLSKKTISREFVSRMNLAIEKIKQTEYYRSNWVW